MCYHTHSSPNESIDFAVLRCTQSIDSFGKNGDIFSICTIYIFQTFFGTFPMTFLQKFSNQKVQFSIKINNIPKKPFEKSVRNISIHLKLLSCYQSFHQSFSQRTNERPEIHRFGHFPDIQISGYINKKVPNLAVQTNGYGPDMENSIHFGPLLFMQSLRNLFSHF